VGKVSGWVRARLALPERCRGTGSRWNEVAGFGPAEIVYVGLCDFSTLTSRLVEWNPRTGTVRDLISEPLHTWTMNDGSGGADGRAYTILKGDGPRFVSVPTFHEAYSGSFELLAYDAAGALLWKTQLREKVSPFANLAVASEDKRGFMTCSELGMEEFDLRDGKSIGRVQPPRTDSSGTELAASKDGRFIFSSRGRTNEIMIFDVEERVWLPPLTYANTCIGPSPIPSPDGRWLAACGFDPQTLRTAAPPGNLQYHLLLFDTSKLPRAGEGR